MALHNGFRILFAHCLLTSDVTVVLTVKKPVESECPNVPSVSHHCQFTSQERWVHLSLSELPNLMHRGGFGCLLKTFNLKRTREEWMKEGKKQKENWKFGAILPNVKTTQKVIYSKSHELVLHNLVKCVIERSDLPLHITLHMLHFVTLSLGIVSFG